MNFLDKDTLTISVQNTFTVIQTDDMQPSMVLFKVQWALAHLFILQAISLHATAKHTFAIRRTQACRFRGIASAPSLLLRSLRVSCTGPSIQRSVEGNTSDPAGDSGVISRRKSPTVSRALQPFHRDGWEPAPDIDRASCMIDKVFRRRSHGGNGACVLWALNSRWSMGLMAHWTLEEVGTLFHSLPSEATLPTLCSYAVP